MKGKILAGFVLIFLAISLVGYYSFDSLTRLVTALELESRPNPKNLQLKEILYDLSNAESSVRAYTITLDATYLSPYYETVTTIDRKLMDLYELTQEDNQELLWLDSLANLINQKYFALNDLIEMKQDDNRQDVLNQVLENIDRYDRALLNLEPINRSNPNNALDNLPAVSPVEVETRGEIQIKKPNIFQRLFGGKKKANNDSAEMNITRPALTGDDEIASEEGAEGITQRPPDDLDEFKEKLVTAVARLKQNEKNSAESSIAREIELFELDNKIMTEIRNLILKFEERERQNSITQSNNAELMTRLTKNRIYWIGGGSLGLFTILVIIIIRDVSVNKKTRIKLQEAKEEAEKLANVKEEFLSNISHEIRTPINSILGFARQLEKTSLDTRQRAYLDILSKSSDHLLALINDVLDYSKLESGNVTLEKIGFKPLVCIDEVKEALKPFAESKGLKLDTAFEEVPEILIGDPVRYRQVLINLVNNAIKFTKNGSVTIKVGATMGAGRCKLLTRIIDTGIGIPESKIFAIFKTFNQVDNTTTREYGGSGLGLSICKKLVEAQNGKIWVTSKLGQGSTFNFEIVFPVGNENDLPESSKSAYASNGNVAEKNILVVDDENYNLLLFRTILENHQARVITTDKPDQVVKILKENPIDLILMDIQMPVQDGITLTRKLRKDHNIRIPILALTATTNNTERTKCVQAGFDGFLVKPVEESELINSIANFIGWDQVTENASGQKSSEGIDLDNLFEIGNNDLDFVYNMLLLFVNNFCNGLNDLTSGLHSQDFQALSNVAHKMIPPCRHLGLNEIVSDLKSIEEAEKNGISIKELEVIISNLDREGKEIVDQIKKEIERIKPPEVKSFE